ncbi:MAG: hypothetical protein NT167_15895 [Verrucomicrobia bacterium]|nr:hypothetical protein [Verrucomicrobiota bacterium]
MSKPQRKPKGSASKQSRRLKPRASKKPLITPAEARRRAQRYVLNRIFKGAAVRDGATVRLGIYFRDKWTAKDVWVVYKNSEGFGLKSSDVVLVSKRTGRVLYEGSACDEG